MFFFNKKIIFYSLLLLFLLNIKFINCIQLNNYNNWQNYQKQNVLSSSLNTNLISNTKISIKTKNLSGGRATNGNNETIATILNLMKVGILNGFAVRRIKMFNNRVYLERYRRSYWFGTRYYELDNRYYFKTRDTCSYRMNETERYNIEYEENREPILDIIYQCQRYVQYCCGLDCCQQQQ